MTNWAFNTFTLFQEKEYSKITMMNIKWIIWKLPKKPLGWVNREVTLTKYKSEFRKRKLYAVHFKHLVSWWVLKHLILQYFAPHGPQVYPDGNPQTAQNFLAGYVDGGAAIEKYVGRSLLHICSSSTRVAKLFLNLCLNISPLPFLLFVLSKDSSNFGAFLCITRFAWGSSW